MPIPDLLPDGSRVIITGPGYADEWGIGEFGHISYNRGPWEYWIRLDTGPDAGLGTTFPIESFRILENDAAEETRRKAVEADPYRAALAEPLPDGANIFDELTEIGGARYILYHDIQGRMHTAELEREHFLTVTYSPRESN